MASFTFWSANGHEGIQYICDLLVKWYDELGSVDIVGYLSAFPIGSHLLRLFNDRGCKSDHSHVDVELSIPSGFKLLLLFFF